jgi:gamma-tubulin complex component 2
VIWQDYQTLLTQLEHSFATSAAFSLQKLWFYVHPTLHTLSLIYSLITELSQSDDAESASEDMSDDDEKNEELGLGSGLKAVLNEMAIGGGGIVKGGEVVAILWERVTNMSGDPSARELYRKLLRDAARPYVTILEGWMTTGFLKDPYEEVMVKESKFINRGTLQMDYTDEYWERRYTVSGAYPMSLVYEADFTSCEMVLTFLLRPSDTKQACLLRDLLGVDSLVEHVFLRSSKRGSTRSCSPGST